jgi:hypothetical protein
MSTKLILLSLVLGAPCFAFAQSQPASDPQAVTLAAQSITALTGGASVSDVTLTGNATWTQGSDNETGAATLYAKGSAESRVDLNLTGGLRSDIRNDTAGYPQGASVIGGGGQQAWALHNCWIDASWFFPALSFLGTTSDSQLVFTYIAQESRNGENVQHIQISRYLGRQMATVIALTQRLSTIDVYLDSGSFLPVAFTFNTHPDSDAATNIAVEVDFSNYQDVNGVQVPFHIQRFLQGSLALDIAVTRAIFNSGLQDALFSIQGS